MSQDPYHFFMSLQTVATSNFSESVLHSFLSGNAQQNSLPVTHEVKVEDRGQLVVPDLENSVHGSHQVGLEGVHVAV